MNETPKGKSGWRILRRILIGLAILATLIAIFYAEEDWRGKRAWEQCKTELEAKGAVLDWDKFIPPPVPDGQNIFKAPNMQAWFVKSLNVTTNELTMLVTNADKVATITDKAVAAHFLAWSDQFQPVFDSLREALKRPYARMDGDYSRPYEIPIPNFVTVRAFAQTLAQRAHCYLLLGQPEKALAELTLLNDSRRLLEGEPIGKPITLVAAMINVAVTGLYVDTIADGMRMNAWRELQLVALQKQFKEINLMPFVVEAFNEEPAAMCRAFETTKANELERLFFIIPRTNLWQKLNSPLFLFITFAPRGWVYRNMVAVAGLERLSDDSFDLTNNLISPRKQSEFAHELTIIASHPSFFNFLAAMAAPNTLKASQTLAHNQTLANEAQIVCALERYRLTHGEYPETLDALVPQFIEKLPHDIIGGQPLHYRRTDPPSQNSGAASGKFLLYSVGWNETDDGGQVALKQDGSEDWTNGDWVWKN